MDPSNPTLPHDPASKPTVPSAPPDLRAAPPEDRFGRYIRTALLGAGGMGEVWKAWDAELNRWVALKFLKGSNDNEIARLRREAQTAATLSHPNIAAVYEVVEASAPQGRRHFIAMQLVAGQTLDSFPRHDVRALVEILRDAARAVQHAHERGVIHRDLKPANLMVEDATRRLFVMDFGLAKQTSIASSMSMSGIAVGTPAYMPPEQAAGRPRDVDARSDVYGLGATLYELITDKPPFRGEDLLSVLRNVVDQEPTPPRLVKAAVDADLETIVLKCLEKERDRRYATACELADDLTRWLAGEPIRARAPSMGYRVRKYLAKRRLAAALVAGLLVAVVGAAVLARGLWRARSDVDISQRRLQEAQLYLPLENSLALLRMKFYQPAFRLTDADFAEYDALAAKVEAQMAKTGESAQGRYLIGRCRDVVADVQGADASYSRALELDPDHAPTLLALGRLRIEGALMLRVTLGARDRDRRAAERGDAAAQLIERGSRLAGPGFDMQADLARCYVAAIRNWRQRTAVNPAAELARKWSGRPFAEEFILLTGMTGFHDDMVAAAGQVIALMPSSAPAYYWRSFSGLMPARIADLDRAIAINPRFTDARIQRGNRRYEMDDHRAAVDDFDAAIRLDPSRAALYVNRAQARRGAGDFPGAIDDATRALALQPDFPAARGALAYALAEAGRLADALREIENAFGPEPDAETFLDRANLRTKAGDFDGAIDDLNHAIQIDRSLSKSYVARSVYRRRFGDVKGAREDAERAVECDPNSAPALGVRALAFADWGDHARAIEDAKRAAELRPRNAYILGEYAEILYMIDRLKESVELWDRVLALEPRVASSWAGRGLAKYDLHDAEGALSDFNRALAIDPRCTTALTGRAVCRLDAREFEAALKDVEAAIALERGNGGAYAMRGRIHHRMGDHPRALADYNRAFTFRPNDVALFHNRGALRYAMGEFDDAIVDLTAALERNPKLVDALLTRGGAHYARGRVDEAIADFTRALTVAPRRTEGWLNRGILRRQRGETTAAIADFSEVLALDPDNAGARSSRAALRQSIGAADDAIDDYNEILKRLPKDATALVNRGLCYKQLGDLDRARADLKKALEIAPAEWPLRGQVEELLRGL